MIYISMGKILNKVYKNKFTVALSSVLLFMILYPINRVTDFTSKYVELIFDLLLILIFAFIPLVVWITLSQKYKENILLRVIIAVPFTFFFLIYFSIFALLLTYPRSKK